MNAPVKLKSKSLAKIKLHELLSNTKDGDEYAMEVDNVQVPLEKADAFVHRLRVELSRIRKRVIEEHSRVPKHFKLLFISAENHPTKSGFIIIKLKRTTTKVSKVADDLDSIIGEIAGGPLING